MNAMGNNRSQWQYYMFHSRYTTMAKYLGEKWIEFENENVYDMNALVEHMKEELGQGDVEQGYHPFHIRDVQLYNPVYSCFTDLENVGLKRAFKMVNSCEIMDSRNGEIKEIPTFTKFSPLLDPVKYMIGKYNSNDERLLQLPKMGGANANVFPKYLDKNNVAYVDCFFSNLSSRLLHDYGFVHGIDFYGCCTGIQEKYKMNVADDLDYICESKYFHEHVGKLFTISDESVGQVETNDSRCNKKRLEIGGDDDADIDSVISLGVESIGGDGDVDISDDVEEVYERASVSSSSHEDDDDDESDDSDSEGSENTSCSDETMSSSESGSESSESGSESSESGSGSESFSEEEIYAYINNFPVQMICLEKCEGTFDRLLEDSEIDKDEGMSALFQIVMTLLVYQKVFKMTHNDLHTNNIMYKSTDVEYLYYKYGGKHYRVPTFGRIYKIIDFGRAIYKCQGELFCSDSFAHGGDAYSQYNCEPFFNESKPRLEPNMSFDLCRLGCSMYDFLIDDDDVYEDLDEFQKIIADWCNDDQGKHMLYKKNGQERYPNFKLYKMIARTVHKHSPENQFTNGLFADYEVECVDQESAVMDIDAMPTL
jgi:hypothetical protein